MATTRTVQVNVVGDASGLSRTLGTASKDAEAAGGRISGAFKTSFSALRTVAGGALEPLEGVFHGIESAMDSISEKHVKVGQAIMGVGAAGVGIGASLTAFGSKDKAADQQLAQTYQNIGASVDDYKDRIDGAVKSMAKYGYTGDQVKDALSQLTIATKDPAKALDLLSTAANLAATKHEDLSQSVTQMNQIIAGKGTRVLQQLGITTQVHAQAAKQAETAVKQQTAAQDGLTKAQERLAQTEQRLGVVHTQHAVSTAAVTSAQKALQAEQNKVALLEEKQHSGAKWTLADDQALSVAKQAVIDKTAALTKAQSDYTSKEAAAASTRGLSISQQQQLANAQQAVTAAQAKLAAATGKVTSAQDAAGKAAGGLQANIDAVAAATNGQANAAADTFTGKMKALRAEVENQVAAFGQKYGPAVTAAGAGMTVLGGVVETGAGILGHFRQAQDAAKVAQEAATAATEAGTVANEGMAASEAVSLGPILLVIAAVAALGVGIYELVTHWKTVWSTVKAVAADAWHFLDDNLLHPIEHGFDDLMGFFGRVPGFIQTAMRDVGRFIADPYIWGINKVIDAWNWLMGMLKIPGFSLGPIHFGGIDLGGGLKISEIPMLAAGGIVSSPTLAMIGEGNQPEAVIPLDRLGGLGGAGHVTIEVPVIIDGRQVAAATAHYTRDELLRGPARNAKKVGLA